MLNIELSLEDEYEDTFTNFLVEKEKMNLELLTDCINRGFSETVIKVLFTEEFLSEYYEPLKRKLKESEVKK